MIAAVGVVARLRQLTAGRSLWLDETFVALDLQQQTLMESLIDGSPRNQLAPAGFWAVSHAAETVSSAEWVLRAFPFVGGLVLVALAVVYAERHLASVAARVLLVATVAWSPVLVHYAAELKQYGLEATVSMAAAFAIAARDRIGTTGRVGLGLLFLSLSMPALLLVPLLGLMWLADEVAQHGTGPAIRRLALPGTVLAVGQVGLLAYALRVEPDMMQGFWVDAFAPLPTSGSALRWWVESAVGAGDLALLSSGIASHEIRGDIFSFAPVAVATALWALVVGGGLVAWRRRDPGRRSPAARAWWAVVPAIALIATAFVAAALTDLYPLRGRLLIHAVPLLFVAAAHGLDLLVDAARGDGSSEGRAATVLVGTAGAVAAIAGLIGVGGVIGSPSRQYDSRAALSWIAERHQPGESIIYSRESVHLYDFYGPQVGLGILPELYADPLLDGDALVRQAGDTPSWYFNGFIREDQGHLPFIEQMAEHPGVVDVLWADGTVAFFIDPAAAPG